MKKRKRKTPQRLLTDQYVVVIKEAVNRDFEVKGSRAFANTARGVVVGTVARAEPAVVITRVGDGHTAQVSADTQHHQELGLLRALLILLGILELGELCGGGARDFGGRAVTNEDGLTTPLHGEGSASGDVVDGDFDGTQREHISRGRHRGDEAHHSETSGRRIHEASSTSYGVVKKTALALSDSLLEMVVSGTVLVRAGSI